MLKELLTPLSLLILAGAILYDHVVRRPAPSPAPAPAVNGVALGRAFSTVLESTYADAWLAAAQALEEGRSVADAQKVLQDTWKEARVKAFTSAVGPSFALVLPEGREPASPVQRAQVVELWRAFAKGLKSVR
jgi:hypothetical protein